MPFFDNLNRDEGIPLSGGCDRAVLLRCGALPRMNEADWDFAGGPSILQTNYGVKRLKLW